MPHHLSVIAALLIGLALTNPALAGTGTLQSEASVGSQTTAEALTYDGASAGKEPHWTWNLGYTYTHLVTTDSSGQDVADNSQEGTGGLSYENGILFGFGYQYTTTPEESLTATGPNLSLGYGFKWGEDKSPKDEDEDEDEEAPFTPSFSLKGTATWLNFVESFNRPARLRLRPLQLNASEEIRQTELALEANLSPLEWFTATLTYTKYSYNKSVAAFLALLDNPRAVNTAAAGFSTTLQGFAQDSYELELSFVPWENWEVIPKVTDTLSASDGTWGQGYSLKLTRRLGDWKLGLGAEREISTALTESIAVADLSYDF